MQDSQSSKLGKFNAACKLLRADGFEHVIQAKNITDEQFKIFFTPNQGKHARLGIITSKKTLPSAVNRNRVKRIIREVFRQHNIKQYGLDLVVMVRRKYSPSADAPLDNLKKLFHQLEIRCADL
ncbi:MAG: ribonuclease P protein component [Gallionella sp.]|nr:ribonuclease P protein component [Gallionella sp.]